MEIVSNRPREMKNWGGGTSRSAEQEVVPPQVLFVYKKHREDLPLKRGKTSRCFSYAL